MLERERGTLWVVLVIGRRVATRCGEGVHVGPELLDETTSLLEVTGQMAAKRGALS